MEDNIFQTEGDSLVIVFCANCSFTAAGNTMQSDLRPCIFMGECWASNFSISRNNVAGAMGLILFYCFDSTGEIHDNTFNLEDYAVALYRGFYDSKVSIFDNDIFVGYEDTPGPINGIFSQILRGEINIVNNSIESAASGAAGINVWVSEDENGEETEPESAGLSSLAPLLQAAGAKGAARKGRAAPATAGSGEAKINIEGNRVSGLTYGIGLYVSPETVSACNAAIHANIMRENQRGLDLDLIINHPDSTVAVFNNLFQRNERGITIENLSLVSADSVTAFLNSFTGNTVAAIANKLDGIIFNAPLNWWGSAAGPSTEGNATGGDFVEGVNYEPWLKELKLSTSGNSLKDGGVNKVKATLLDSAGSVVETDLLEVLFTVTGANNLSEVVKLAGGVATFSYKDRSPGTDTIAARLLFAGEAAADYLESEAQTTWKAGSAEKRELPRTTAAMPVAGLAGLACLLAGAALRARRRKGADS
ncbi:MAG TPA: hypothetical protein PLY40_09755 [Bacillota bacterium]|nr:hypothetical protein [Bacillota bacterium]